MTSYRKIIRATGVVNYFLNGHYIKMEDWGTIPQGVIDMEPGDIQIEDIPEVVKVEKPVRLSIISGEPGTKQRYVNGQTYWLTDEEYKTCTLGEIYKASQSKLDGCVNS